jgi:hypothetical protein
LRKNSLIRKFSAAFFLLLFSFCVTPKRFLHDLLANHKDASSTTVHLFEQVAKSGFHCHVDELVVVEPFLPGVSSPESLALPSSKTCFSELTFSVFLTCTPSADNRGPPASFLS